MRTAALRAVAVLGALFPTALALAGTQDFAVIALHDQPLAKKAVNICPTGPAPEDPNTQGLPASSTR